MAMHFPGSRHWKRHAIWLSVAAILTMVLLLRLNLSFDLSAFFPRETSLANEVLLQQLRQGPGSRLLVIGIQGGTKTQRAETSRRMRETLARDRQFANVFNGELDLDTVSVPEPVRSGYLLMADVDLASPALAKAVQQRLRDLSFGGGATLRDIVAFDPYLATLDLMQRLAPAKMDGGLWLAADGSVVLLAETRAAGVDLIAQAQAIDSVQQAFADLRDAPDMRLEITGVGAFSVELEQTIRAEARFRSILAGIVVTIILLVALKSLRLFFMAALPAGMGFLAGLAAVALLFDEVHGITLAFGFTLLGLAGDYPLHFFSHARGHSGLQAIKAIWPTMWLGAATTAIAFLAMVFLGSSGLAQLGVFSSCGVVVAALVTRYWLPVMLSVKGEVGDLGGPLVLPQLSHMPAASALLLALLVIQLMLPGGLWNDELSALSPVDPGRIQRDRVLRSATTSSDMRYQLVLNSATVEQLLRESEQVDSLLQAAAADGLLAGWTSVTALLPSAEVQARRLQSIPDTAELDSRLQAAISGTPFRADAFAPFLVTAAAAKSIYPIESTDFDGSPLASWRDAHLVHLDEHWVALVTLVQPHAESLVRQIKSWPVQVEWLDLQQSTRSLMRDFRREATIAVGTAVVLILSLLTLERIGLRRLLWIASTVTGSLAVTIAVVVYVHGALTLIHLVALLLVLGLDLDYALFFSREDSLRGRQATLRSIIACAASTVLPFFILSQSSIPVLKFIGLTVATGSSASFILAYLGQRSRNLSAD